ERAHRGEHPVAFSTESDCEECPLERNRRHGGDLIPAWLWCGNGERTLRGGRGELGRARLPPSRTPRRGADRALSLQRLGGSLALPKPPTGPPPSPPPTLRSGRRWTREPFSSEAVTVSELLNRS